MKRFILALSVLSAFVSYANLTGNNYYRIQNYGSGRWATMVDNQGSADIVAGKADLHSLGLYKDTEQILADPGSIVYINKISGNQYDLVAQGTSFQKLVNHAINIGTDGSANGQTLYRMYGTYSNVTRYIADENTGKENQGIATIQETMNPNYMKWLIIPVDVTTDNYFGTVPTVAANGHQYTSLFTSFAYQPYSDGVKAYYISRVGFGMAEMVEIEGAVPPGSPVIIQCAGNNVSNNKLQLVEYQDALPSNALSGAYFDYYYNKISNRIEYDPETMRVLGVCSDGSLGFVTSSTLEAIPANTAYLVVPKGSSPEFKCVSPEAYAANIPQAPDMFYYDADTQILPQDEYNYTGTLQIPADDANKNVSIKFYADSYGSAVVLGPDAKGNVALNSSNVSLPFSYGSDYSWVLQNWPGGEVAVTINILYQYVTFSTKTAGVGSITNGLSGLTFTDNIIYSESGSPIKVMNMTGQVVSSSNGAPLDISSLPKGIYIAVSNGKSLKIAR